MAKAREGRRRRVEAGAWANLIYCIYALILSCLLTHANVSTRDQLRINVHSHTPARHSSMHPRPTPKQTRATEEATQKSLPFVVCAAVIQLEELYGCREEDGALSWGGRLQRGVQCAIAAAEKAERVPFGVPRLEQLYGFDHDHMDCGSRVTAVVQVAIAAAEKAMAEQKEVVAFCDALEKTGADRPEENTVPSVLKRATLASERELWWREKLEDICIMEDTISAGIMPDTRVEADPLFDDVLEAITKLTVLHSGKELADAAVMQLAEERGRVHAELRRIGHVLQIPENQEDDDLFTLASHVYQKVEGLAVDCAEKDRPESAGPGGQ